MKMKVALHCLLNFLIEFPQSRFNFVNVIPSLVYQGVSLSTILQPLSFVMRWVKVDMEFM